MPGCVLLVAPGAAADDRLAQAFVDAARLVGVALQRLQPATENALRQRLAAGGVELLVYVGSGRARAAAHATLELDSSSGPEPRAVNLRHFAATLSSAVGLRGVVLVSRQSGAFAGFAQALAGHGAAAAMVWEPSALSAGAVMPTAFLQRWREGASWFELASDASAAEVAGESPAATSPPAVPLQRVEPSSPAIAASAAPAPPTDAKAQRAQAIEQQLAAKRAAGQFDVFLCHNSADKPAVRAIARQLRARGILPWLDEWELPPGQPWQPLLERQIERIQSAAVFVGHAGVGPWQEQELYGFLREFVARKAPVIPVLLPDAPSAPELPVFLRAMTYVDFRQREPEPMARLEWGITGVRPAYD